MRNLHKMCTNLLTSTMTAKAVGAACRRTLPLARIVLPLRRRDRMLLPRHKILIDGFVFELVEFIIFELVDVGWLLLLLVVTGLTTSCALLIRGSDCEGLYDWIADNVGLVEEASEVVLTQVAVVVLVQLVCVVGETV